MNKCDLLQEYKVVLTFEKSKIFYIPLIKDRNNMIISVENVCGKIQHPL